MGGLFRSLFGISSIFGPLQRGHLAVAVHWSWIFYINLPLSLIAFVMVLSSAESVEHSKQIDYLGAFTLVASIVCLMFLLELGGKAICLGLQYDYQVCSQLLRDCWSLGLSSLELRAQDRLSPSACSGSRYMRLVLQWLFWWSGFLLRTPSTFPSSCKGVLGGSASKFRLVLLPMMLGTVVTLPPVRNLVRCC